MENLTKLDNELLTGLQLLSDSQLDRVQAHLTAGLPMKKGWGWENENEAACFGCLIGIAMPKSEFLRSNFANFACFIFLRWVDEKDSPRPLSGDLEHSLSPGALKYLAELVDMEWQRRHPVDQAEKEKMKILENETSRVS